MTKLATTEHTEDTEGRALYVLSFVSSVSAVVERFS
jgi:hypothetical protein